MVYPEPKSIGQQCLQHEPEILDPGSRAIRSLGQHIVQDRLAAGDVGKNAVVCPCGASRKLGITRSQAVRKFDKTVQIDVLSRQRVATDEDANTALVCPRLWFDRRHIERGRRNFRPRLGLDLREITTIEETIEKDEKDRQFRLHV